MNPLFQALTGGMTSPVQNPVPMQNGLAGALQNVMGRAQQLAQMFQNPQQLVQRYFPDAPTDVSGDPEHLIGWLQQTGKVSPQMVQMARQLMGR